MSYRQSLLFDVDVMLAMLVVPTHCLKSVLTHKCANPFLHVQGTPIYLPPPCLYSCSFCCNKYNDLCPPLVRDGVFLVLMDLFLGDNIIAGDITFVPVLLDKIKKYPNSDCILFGVNSDKEPALVTIKEMLLILIASNIIRHACTLGSKGKENKLQTKVTIEVVLKNSRSPATGMLQYALFDNHY